MRLLASACAVPLLIVAAPRRVDACSCGATEPSFVPVDAATGVPLNARIIVRDAYLVDRTVELRDATTGELVPTTQQLPLGNVPADNSVVFLSPAAPLAPNTTYSITVSIGALPALHTSTFTTGDSVDLTPPVFAGISALTLETMDWPLPDEDGQICVSSCVVTDDGHISRTRFDYADPPSDVVYVGLQLYRPGEDVLEIPVPTFYPRSLDYFVCAARSPTLVPGADYCARLIAYDVAGNVAGQGAELCATTERCEPLGDPRFGPMPNCEPSNECRPLQPDAGGGCASSRAPAWLVALAALACMRRKRKRPERRSTLGPGFRDHPGR